MFAGIVVEKGRVVSAEQGEKKWRLGIAGEMFSSSSIGVAIGDSISISGVCLTVVHVEQGAAYFDLATETRRCTTLGEVRPGDGVNLERSLCFGESVDGHFVQGHVDAVSQITSCTQEDNTWRYEFLLPEKIRSLVASKGSICIDGVSLTVGEVTEQTFSVYIIPHTFAVTTFSDYRVGSRVNLEADCIARYLARLAECYLAGK